MTTLPPVLANLIETTRTLVVLQADPNSPANGYLIGHPLSQGDITFLRDFGPWKEKQVLKDTCLCFSFHSMLAETRDTAFEVIESYKFSVIFDNYIA